MRPIKTWTQLGISRAKFPSLASRLLFPGVSAVTYRACTGDPRIGVVGQSRPFEIFTAFPIRMLIRGICDKLGCRAVPTALQVFIPLSIHATATR